MLLGAVKGALLSVAVSPRTRVSPAALSARTRALASLALSLLRCAQVSKETCYRSKRDHYRPTHSLYIGHEPLYAKEITKEKRPTSEAKETYIHTDCTLDTNRTTGLSTTCARVCSCVWLRAKRQVSFASIVGLFCFYSRSLLLLQ